MKSLKAILYLFSCVILVSGIISCGSGGGGDTTGDGNNNSTVLTQITSTNHKPGSTLIISGTGFNSINSNSKLVCNNTEFPIIGVNDSSNQLTSVVPIESDCNVYLAVSSTTSSNSLSLTIEEASLPNNVTAAEVNSKIFNTLASVNTSLDDTVQSNASTFGFSSTEAQQISDELKNTEALLTAYNNYVENNLTAAEQEQLAELYYNAGIYDLMSELEENSTPQMLALSIRSASGSVSAKSVDASSLSGVVFLDYVSASLSLTRAALTGVSIAAVVSGAGTPVAAASELLKLKLGIADSVIDGILLTDLKSITTSVPLNLNIGQDLDFILIGTFAPQSTLIEATLEGLMLSIDVENADALIEEVLNIALSTVSGYAIDQIPYVNDLGAIEIDSMEIEFDASYYMGYQTVLNVLGVGLIFEAIDKLTFGSSNLTVDAPVIADTNVAVMSPDYKTISGVGQGTTTLTVEGLVLNEIDLGYLSWLTFGIEAPEAVVATIPITVSETVASFNLPDTGQTQSYTSTFGEDSDYSINPMSFTDNGNGTVTDNVTDLMWQQQDDGISRTWDNAGTYCSSLSLGGYSDWRLPSKKEFITIINYGTSSPAIDLTYFPNTKSSPYWSSTTSTYGTLDAWRVYFLHGHFNSDSSSSNTYVRCVRSGQYPAQSFTDNGNGTVTDNVTDLMWQQQDDGTERSWRVAIVYCEGLSLGGQTDWRLPNIKELESITDDSTYNPAIDTTYFSNTQSLAYWSSTTTTANTDYAQLVHFYAGLFYNGFKDSAFSYVRCVRSLGGGGGSGGD